MNTDNMNTFELEARGIDQSLVGDVEGQEAEYQATMATNLIEAIQEFLILGTKEDLTNLIARNF